jgi:hypothetical protein
VTLPEEFLNSGALEFFSEMFIRARIALARNARQSCESALDDGTPSLFSGIAC